MMTIFSYVVWGAAFFFAGSWTFGLAVRPDFRLKSTIASLIFWWLEIALAIFGLFSHFHLLWLMPLSILLPGAVMQTEIRTSLASSVPTIFLKSSLLIGPTIALLVYFSK